VRTGLTRAKRIPKSAINAQPTRNRYPIAIAQSGHKIRHKLGPSIRKGGSTTTNIFYQPVAA